VRGVTDLATPLPLVDDGVIEPLAAESVRGRSKGERTRLRLLEIAVQRFGARGFRNTSVSEIAREAGLTQAASYAYFENKQALFAAAVDDDATGLIDDAYAGASAAPIDLFIPTLILCLLGGLADHPLAHRVLAGQEPEAITNLVDLPALDRFCASMEGRLHQAQADGEIRSDIEPALIASGVQALVVALLMSTIQTGGQVDERHQLGVVAAFGAMLQAPAAS
jgi:AcrR family transcriptional regulator